MLETSFDIYDEKTVARLVEQYPDLLPTYEFNWSKDFRWNKQYINNLITQGVVSGEDIRSLSGVLEKATDANYASAMRTMRTAATSAQNGGRIDVYNLYNKELGLNVKKEWLSTKDNRVRHSHIKQDGEVRDVDEKFTNGCLFPADPNGDACEVYNCRCTLVASFGDTTTHDEATQSARKTTHSVFVILLALMIIALTMEGKQ